MGWISPIWPPKRGRSTRRNVLPPRRRTSACKRSQIARPHPRRATQDDSHGNCGIQWQRLADTGGRSADASRNASAAAGEGSVRVADLPKCCLAPSEVMLHAEPRLCGCWRCRHHRQGGACGAAGPASAPPLSLGRPARRTPGLAAGNRPQISQAHPAHSWSWAARSWRPVVRLRDRATRAFRAVADAAPRLRGPLTHHPVARNRADQGETRPKSYPSGQVASVTPSWLSPMR